MKHFAVIIALLTLAVSACTNPSFEAPPPMEIIAKRPAFSVVRDSTTGVCFISTRSLSYLPPDVCAKYEELTR